MDAPVDTVNDTPAERPVMASAVPTSVASVVLHVAPLTVAESSICKRISLFAVTAEVFTVSVLPVPVGRATLPAAADPHTAGVAEEEQFVVVLIVVPVSVLKLPIPPDGIVVPHENRCVDVV